MYYVCCVRYIFQFFYFLISENRDSIKITWNIREQCGYRFIEYLAKFLVSINWSISSVVFSQYH